MIISGLGTAWNGADGRLLSPRPGVVVGLRDLLDYCNTHRPLHEYTVLFFRFHCASLTELVSSFDVSPSPRRSKRTLEMAWSALSSAVTRWIIMVLEVVLVSVM
jgi:hypothetical protein